MRKIINYDLLNFVFWVNSYLFLRSSWVIIPFATVAMIQFGLAEWGVVIVFASYLLNILSLFYFSQLKIVYVVIFSEENHFLFKSIFKLKTQNSLKSIEDISKISESKISNFRLEISIYNIEFIDGFTCSFIKSTIMPNGLNEFIEMLKQKHPEKVLATKPNPPFWNF